ncbi:SIMPL domain-containing protein [Alkalihalobacillus sp. AL-G]|uniref:SIMPL domain-containing protein n=1 Tax=Alkalihalobacillus sp. AL-G TaxID=2926399 RepID=UPI00272B7BB3|nr:SIMPL domain-containing protein [Alkalihalobacillus sp. AL-G]WLD91777.1 SIMPL domain-containing protein [Alkalihalobacillus sp. AL-G]
MMNQSYYPQPFPHQPITKPDRGFKQNNVMEVFGTGSVTAPPDEVIISIGVQTRGKNVQQAVQENTAKSNQIIEGLKKLGLTNEQIGSSSYTITPVYEYKDGAPYFIEYRVEHLLEIEQKDVTKAGTIYQTAIENGANIARELRFQVSDPLRYYEQALTEALNHAFQKAQSLSSQLAVQINPVPIKLLEVGDQGPIPFYDSAVKFASTEVPIQPQQQVVKAQIKAWFQYLST